MMNQVDMLFHIATLSELFVAHWTGIQTSLAMHVHMSEKPGLAEVAFSTKCADMWSYCIVGKSEVAMVEHFGSEGETAIVTVDFHPNVAMTWRSGVICILMQG